MSSSENILFPEGSVSFFSSRLLPIQWRSPPLTVLCGGSQDSVFYNTKSLKTVQRLVNNPSNGSVVAAVFITDKFHK